MTMETGTMKELGLQVGDVVECIHSASETWTLGKRYSMTDKGLECNRDVPQTSSQSTFRIVSRVSDKPKTWGDMTDAEKGALLLAQHEGKAIEILMPVGSYWREIEVNETTHFCTTSIYRVRPEPVREVVTIEGYVKSSNDCVFSNIRDIVGDTHRITFETIDGKPDCSTIKMEPQDD